MTSLSVGSVLQSGKYEIIKILGQGGFGITYLAKHRLLGTFFAIKEFFPQDYCIREGITSHISVAVPANEDLVSRLRDRFIKEAQNIASLKHPGIVIIHDVFEENNTAYYVMDFIEGKSLDDIVTTGGPLRERAAIDYIIKIAEALDFIHQRKMTHFDVKPANIMVRSSANEPVLIDFGLSKQFNEQGHARSTLLMGVSHGFSALEQYFQDGITGFSPQTDVYSLGATLYFLLTGRIPPEAPRLSGSVIEVPETISPGVAEAIKWAMLSDSEKRCPTARDFIKSLQKCSSVSTRTVPIGIQKNSPVSVTASDSNIVSGIPPREPKSKEKPDVKQKSVMGEVYTPKKRNVRKLLLDFIFGGVLIGVVIWYCISMYKDWNYRKSLEEGVNGVNKESVSIITGEQNVTFNVKGVPFEMIKVEGAGLEPYYIGKTEVTQKLWSAVMGFNPSGFLDEDNPVENISWNDCINFVNRLSSLTKRNFRLPTKKEWIYAAKGGNKSKGYIYSGGNDLQLVAWYDANSLKRHHAVGKKLGN